MNAQTIEKMTNKETFRQKIKYIENQIHQKEKQLIGLRNRLCYYKELIKGEKGDD